MNNWKKKREKKENRKQERKNENCREFAWVRVNNY